jgi:hypothetical protein
MLSHIPAKLLGTLFCISFFDDFMFQRDLIHATQLLSICGSTSYSAIGYDPNCFGGRGASVPVYLLRKRHECLVFHRKDSASEIDGVGRQIADGWKILCERLQCRQHCQQRLRRGVFDDETIAFLSHGVFYRG